MIASVKDKCTKLKSHKSYELEPQIENLYTKKTVLIENEYDCGKNR